MQTELSALEAKLEQLVKLARHLRADNLRLRQELATALSHDRQSSDKMDTARMRLENLLAQIPEEET